MYVKNIGFPKNEGCTRNFLGRGERHKAGDEFYQDKIRASKASVDDVGAGVLDIPHEQISIYDMYGVIYTDNRTKI